MTGSTFAPTIWRDIDNTKAQPNSMGFKGTCAANSTQSTDFLISDDSIVRGLEFLASGVLFGDKVSIYIVDKDGVYFPANTVLSNPVKDFNCVSDLQTQSNYESIVPQKILGGLYFRVTYTNTNLLTSVSFGVNLILLKVLV